MSKVFRRPMFRKGGSTNMNGIMSGIRDEYEDGGPTARQRYEEIIQKYSQPAIDPLSKLLIQGGLRGLSETGGGGTLANLAMAFQEPTEQLFSDLQTRKDLEREAELAGLQMDISDEEKRQARIQAVKDEKERQAFELKKIGVKSQADIDELVKKYELEEEYGTPGTNLQKDYSAERAYENAVDQRVASRGKLKTFEKPNIEQAFPRATAEYDIHILRNLRKTDDPIGKEIAANNFGFVPFDQRNQEFDFDQMVTGGYYYYPPMKVFVQREPKTDTSEGGLFQINPYTFEKSLIPETEKN